MKNDDRNRDKRETLQKIFAASSLGFILVLNTAAGLLLGLAVRKWFGAPDYVIVIGFVFGVISGFYQLIKELLKHDKKDKNKPS